jgi:hypothetical protein
MAEMPKNRRRFWRLTISLAIIGGAGVLVLGTIIPCLVPARASAQRNACINHLRQINDAKELWASETHQTAGNETIVHEVDQHINGRALNCPNGGIYDYGKVGEKPRCSVKGHTL